VSSTWEEPAVTFAAQEWLAVGRPVLTTRRGALVDLVGRAGIETYDGSVAGLIDAIERMRGGERWTRLVRETPPVSGEVELQRWMSDHLAVYSTVAGTHAASSP
jgi:glycosyltransferase involved in cell wall biosynthesis